MSEDEEVYRITRKGVEMVWSWVRMQAQMCEMEHEGKCDDTAHTVAMLLVFLLLPPEYFEDGEEDE